MTDPTGGGDLLARLQQPAPPQIPVVQIPVAFQAGPANVKAQKADTPNGPMIILVVVTPQAAITTFWPEADWKTLIADLSGAWSGLQIADTLPPDPPVAPERSR